MYGVKGIVLDASILLKSGDDENGSPSLRPDADYVLRKLRYSNIFTVKISTFSWFFCHFIVFYLILERL